MKFEVMGFEGIHKHADSSLLDGMATVREYAEYSKEVNQKYLCITDHGVQGSVPAQILESEKHNLTPIFGIEFYINSLQPKVDTREESAEFRKSLHPDLQPKFDKSNHLLALAYNNQGYQNLVRLSSWAWRHGFYKKPRLNHEILNQHKEGIIFTSTCANSEIAQAFFNGGDDAGFDMVERYMAMFGDKFYLELMMLDFKLQKPYDVFLIKAHNRYGIPVTMSCDTHYCRKDHSHYQRLMLMVNGKRTLYEIEALKASGEADDLFELQDSNLWMKSEDELNEKWESDYQDVIDYDLFKQSKANTVKICEMCKGVELDRSIKLPQMDDDQQILREAMLAGFEDRKLPRTKLYLDRLQEEYDLICQKGFASYFLIEKMMVEAGRNVLQEKYGWNFEEIGDCRGPGRGSFGSSLLAYCLDLHDVEPIEHDLVFSRFLSPARGGKQMKVRFSQEPISQQ